MSDKFPYGYICWECAISKGLVWPEGHCATMHSDICEYCNEKKSLAAVTDYQHPSKKGPLVWD